MGHLVCTHACVQVCAEKQAHVAHVGVCELRVPMLLLPVCQDYDRFHHVCLDNAFCTGAKSCSVEEDENSLCMA